MDQPVRHDLVPAPLQLVPQLEIAFGGVVVRVDDPFPIRLFQGQHIEAGRETKFLIQFRNLEIGFLETFAPPV